MCVWVCVHCLTDEDFVIRINQLLATAVHTVTGILPEEFVRSDDKMFYEKAWVTVSALFHSKAVLLGWDEDSQSSSSRPNFLIRVFVDIALCTGAHWCWNRNKPSPNSSHNVGRIKLSKLPWYADALRDNFCDWGCHNKATPSTPLYSWYNAVRQVTNIASFIVWPDREGWLIAPETTSPLL